MAARPLRYGLPHLGRRTYCGARWDLLSDLVRDAIVGIVERVALAQLVNAEIRALAARFDLAGQEAQPYAWLCACGCLTIAHATLAEYDASAGEVFAAGHPAGADRAEATAAFRGEPDPAALTDRIDERRRRELTAELAKRLEQQVMANDGAA